MTNGVAMSVASIVATCPIRLRKLPCTTREVRPRATIEWPRILMTRALYLCYFGLREPLVQTQLRPYLRELAAGGIGMHLLTFERERFDEAPWRERLRAEGITWHTLPHHKQTLLQP